MMQKMEDLAKDVRLVGPQRPGYDTILTPEAIQFVATLAKRFQPGLENLLAKRVKVQAAFDSGEQRLDFKPSTQDIREKEWRVSFTKLPSSTNSHHYQAPLCIVSNYTFKSGQAKYEITAW